MMRTRIPGQALPGLRPPQALPALRAPLPKAEGQWRDAGAGSVYLLGVSVSDRLARRRNPTCGTTSTCPGGVFPRSVARPFRTGLAHVALILSVVTILATTTAAFAKPVLTIGSKRFTESYVLGEVLAQTARKAGEAAVVHKQGLGSTGIVYEALLHGQIDVYPEYTGTISQDILKSKTALSLEQINAQLAPSGLAAGVPLGFNDTYAFAMRESDAKRLGIATISDMAKHPDLRLGLDHEFIQRPDCWAGAKAAYDLPFGAPQGFDHALAFYTALSQGSIDVMDVYTTDANIAKLHGCGYFVTISKFFPPPTMPSCCTARTLPSRLPKTWAAIGKLQGTISADRMSQLNAYVDIDKLTYISAAQKFLSRGTSATVKRGGLIAQIFGPDFWRLTGEHLFLVFVSLFFAILVGIPLGVLSFRSPGTGRTILTTTGLIQTIPSIALLVFLLAAHWSHAGPLPAVIALFTLCAASDRAQHVHGLAGNLPSAARVCDCTGAVIGDSGCAGSRGFRSHRSLSWRVSKDKRCNQCRHRNHRGIYRRGRLRRIGSCPASAASITIRFSQVQSPPPCSRNPRAGRIRPAGPRGRPCGAAQKLATMSSQAQ